MIVLIATDADTIAAVSAAGADVAHFERLGQAAAAGVTGTATLVLLDRGAAVTAAALGGIDAPTALVAAGELPADTFALAELAGVGHVVTLPAGAGWLAAQAKA